MSNILWPPSYYILRDRLPFFLTIIYIYRHKIPKDFIDLLGAYLTFCSFVVVGVSLGLYSIGTDMNFLSGISWSHPSPIEWGIMIITLTGILRLRIPIFDAFYLASITALGGGWLYEFLPLVFHDFNWMMFFKVNAVKVFFMEFQIFCLPIIAYIIATSKKYKRSRFLVPSFIILVLWSAFRPSIEHYVREAMFMNYKWVIRVPAIIFLSLWISGIQGSKEPTTLFPKVKKYIALIPYRIKHYGWNTMAYKIVVDLALKLHIPIPKSFRWKAAHSFQTSWKRQQKNQYGIDEYNRRIDLKSTDVMNNFYEIGLDFQGKTFVDIGCGTRGVLPIIQAKRRIGIDPVIGKLPSFVFPDGVEYLSEKAENISLPDCSVDVVCCNNTLNHVDDPDKALAEMWRILKPGGMFLLEVFIEPENIAHTVSFNVTELAGMVYDLFTHVNLKYELLTVEVDIDENHDGYLPMRWGGIFKK